MKVRPSVKPMCEKCKIIRRKGRVMVNRGLRRQIAARCIDKNSHGFLLLFRAHATEHLILPHKQRLLQVASGIRRIFSFIRHSGQAKSASVIPHTKW